MPASGDVVTVAPHRLPELGVRAGLAGLGACGLAAGRLVVMVARGKGWGGG